ncbi:MAG: signal peptidase I, partial [Longispora sp.]|nr:signal peptidase I [Longispora sp. (in: high G+C Gram-positive bacteria)]
FEAPQSWRSDPSEKDFIKRVVAVGGDHVTCNPQGQVTVNGYALREDYVNNEAGGGRQPCPHPFDVVIPKDRLWVMGDNRRHSGDSSQHTASGDDITTATIDEEAVIGRAFALFWPFGRATWLSVPETFDKIPVSTPSS